MSHVGPQPGPDDDTESRPRADMTSITGRTPEYFAIIIIEFEQVSNYGPHVVRAITGPKTSWPDSVNQLLGIEDNVDNTRRTVQ